MSCLFLFAVSSISRSFFTCGFQSCCRYNYYLFLCLINIHYFTGSGPVHIVGSLHTEIDEDYVSEDEEDDGEYIINPRRACAARVTVVGSVCLCVRYPKPHLSSHKRYHLLNGQ